MRILRQPTFLSVASLMVLLHCLLASSAWAGTMAITRMESSAAPGINASVVLPETARGATGTTPNSYNLFVTQGTPRRTWTAQFAVTGTLTSAESGATLANGDIWVETATGTFASLATPQNINGTAGTGGTFPNTSPMSTGAFRFQLRPGAAESSGNFSGTIQVTTTPTSGGGAATATYTVTAAVTATMAFTRIENAAAVGVGVTAIALAETAAGVSGSASGDYRVVATSSAEWQVSVQITSAFTAAASGAVLPNTGILVDGPAQAIFTAFAAGLPSPSIVLETAALQSSGVSGNFAFKSFPPAGQDSGSYAGTITVTATSL